MDAINSNPVDFLGVSFVVVVVVVVVMVVVVVVDGLKLTPPV